MGVGVVRPLLGRRCRSGGADSGIIRSSRVAPSRRVLVARQKAYVRTLTPPRIEESTSMPRGLKRAMGPILSLTMLTGCAGFVRSCSNFSAENFGANWVLAQIGMDGKPARCWVLRNVSVVNEDKSDGVHWLGRDGDLVHLAGWIDRVQVSGNDFARAGRQIGVTDLSSCQS